MLRDGTADHRHEAGVEAEVRAHINNLKTTSRSALHARPAKIISTEINKKLQSAQVLIMMPSDEALKKTIKRTRAVEKPALPSSLDKFVIMPPFNLTENGENFLIKDSANWSTESDQLNGERIIIFGTEPNLRNLCRASQLFVDGTFSVAPKNFLQLFSIHAEVEGHVFPLIFALMSKRSYVMYEYLWKTLKVTCEKMGLILNPKFFTLDMEAANIKALKAVFPKSSLKACFFHYCQALFRKLSALGLKEEYLKRTPEIHDTVKMCYGLALVPLNEIPKCFEVIQENAPDTLDGFLEYLKKNFVLGGRRKNPRFAHSLWNVHDICLTQRHKTNNFAESFHSRFIKRVQEPHPDEWRFIDCLKEEQSHTEQQIFRLLTGQSLTKTSRTRFERRKADVFKMVTKFDRFKDNNELCTFLKLVSTGGKVDPTNDNFNESSISLNENC